MLSSKRALFKSSCHGLINFLRKTRRVSESSIKSWKLMVKRGSKRRIMGTNLSMMCLSRMFMPYLSRTLKKSIESLLISQTMLKTLVHHLKLLKIMIF